MTNTEQLKIALSYRGKGGSVFRKYCGLPAGAFYCCAYVVTIFAKAGNSALFCDSRKVTYCPTAIKWCAENLAQIPMYLAMPSDVIFFDWQPNEVPDHIGFVVERKSADSIITIEGNTSGGIVAVKERTAHEVQAIYRPHFEAKFDTSKPLVIDGQLGYSSIAMLQLALGEKVDGILGLKTVKALQRKVGVTADGVWSTKTSKAIQRMLKVKDDGLFGENSVKALQKWINANVKPQAVKPQPQLEPQPTKKLVEDGYMGEATVKATQKICGTIQDGVISGQLKKNAKYYPNVTAVTFGGGGSLVVEKIQKWLGVTVDGILGKDTISAWQSALGVTVDGVFGEKSVKAWQKYLNTHDKLIPIVKPNKQKLADTARSLAWAKGTAKKKYAWHGGSATTAFKKALDKYYPTHKNWSKAPSVGCCCDVFVGTVVRASGLDAKFPRGFDEQIKYTSKAFDKLVYHNVTPYSVARDGDVILYTKNKKGTEKHVLMKADGVIYEAQYEKTYGHVNTAVKKKLDVKRPKVVIFRPK